MSQSDKGKYVSYDKGPACTDRGDSGMREVTVRGFKNLCPIKRG